MRSAIRCVYALSIVALTLIEARAAADDYFSPRARVGIRSGILGGGAAHNVDTGRAASVVPTTEIAVLTGWQFSSAVAIAAEGASGIALYSHDDADVAPLPYARFLGLLEFLSRESLALSSLRFSIQLTLGAGAVVHGYCSQSPGPTAPAVCGRWQLSTVARLMFLLTDYGRGGTNTFLPTGWGLQVETRFEPAVADVTWIVSVVATIMDWY